MSDYVSKCANDTLFAKYKAEMEKRITAEKDLTNINYLKYCIIVRNEIEKFDSYAYETNPVFQCSKSDDYFADYNSWKEEKLRLRWLHTFKYSSQPEVQFIRQYLPPTITIGSFAGYINKAYRLMSQDIHNF